MKKILILVIAITFTLAMGGIGHAKEYGYEIKNGKAYYYDKINDHYTLIEKADMTTFTALNQNYAKDKNSAYIGYMIITDADAASFEIINDYYAKDKNNVYWFFNVNGDGSRLKNADPNTFKVIYQPSPGYGKPQIFYAIDKNKAYWSNNTINADPSSFEVINPPYSKDKNNIFFNSINMGADLDTFEILSEDNDYSMDKNNMYYRGIKLNKQGTKITNSSLYKNLKGKIILKVESSGEAYYIHPVIRQMYFLSQPAVAFNVMRNQGIGITNKDLEKISVADNYCPSYLLNCDNSSAHNINFAKQQNGKIFLQVEKNGEAWYINPKDAKRYFLGKPTDAFNIMKTLGLGISNANFDLISDKYAN